MSASNQHSNPHVEQLARSLAELHEASEGWPEDNRYVRAAIAGEAALQALVKQLETAQREQALDRAWVTMDHYEDLLAERDGLQEQLAVAREEARAQHPDHPRTQYVPMSRELVEALSAEWGDTVQFRIEDGSLVFRRGSSPGKEPS